MELQLALQLTFQNLSDTELAFNGFTDCTGRQLLRLHYIVCVPCLGVAGRLEASKRASQLNTREFVRSNLANTVW